MNRYAEIRRWDNREVIHSGKFNSIKECLEDGVKKGVSFYRADLYKANLSRANLRKANLREAKSTRADFEGANLLLANLSMANLREVNLREANLLLANSTRAYFEGADLYKADLYGAILTGVNLRKANLLLANSTRADFERADLTETNLKAVYLLDCTGNDKEIKNIDIFEEYKVVYTKDILQIGCQGHPIEEWEVFSDEVIFKMDGQKGLDFWHKNKEFIFNKIKKDPAL